MKRKLLFLNMFYPFTIGHYFLKALEAREDLEVKTVGAYTGTWIPWAGGMNLLPKYSKHPDIMFDKSMVNKEIPWDYVKAQLGDWQPDIVMNTDAMCHWDKKPDVGKVVTIGTDPHVLNDWYQKPRQYSDYFFNMQKFYEKSGDIYLPYAYSTYDHYPVETTSKAYDVALIGMLYPNRIQLRDALNAAGYQTMFANGAVFDEARALYAQSRIGISWSSLQDLIARVFEIMAMGLVPIINRVPDLPLHFKEGEHYLGFDTVSEAMEKVKLVKENAEIGDTIIANARKAVAPHSYDNRVKFILETIDAA
jgi:hypothetical protein